MRGVLRVRGGVGCREGVGRRAVVRGFIADLREILNYASDPREDGYQSNGSDERMLARQYYERVGYPFMRD